jgi:hypothetical protein
VCRSKQGIMVTVEEKYFNTKHRPVGILLKCSCPVRCQSKENPSLISVKISLPAYALHLLEHTAGSHCCLITVYTPGFTAHFPTGNVVTQFTSVNPGSTGHEFLITELLCNFLSFCRKDSSLVHSLICCLNCLSSASSMSLHSGFCIVLAFAWRD